MCNALPFLQLQHILCYVHERVRIFCVNHINVCIFMNSIWICVMLDAQPSVHLSCMVKPYILNVTSKLFSQIS